MATLREGPWGLGGRVFAGRARPAARQVSRTVRGGRRTAAKVAAELESRCHPEGKRTVAELLEPLAGAARRSVGTLTAATRTAGPKSSQRAAWALGGRALKVEDMDRWMLRLREPRCRLASIHNQLSVLRAALAQAVRWDWISRNPAALASPAPGPDGLATRRDARRGCWSP